MQIFTPDDSSIVPPADDTPGMKFMAQIEAKAHAIYPDHGESRAKYIREMVVVKINELEHDVETLRIGMRHRGETGRLG